MAELIWTEPALSDLDTIADYISLDNLDAARDLVRRVFRHVEQLAKYPQSGSRPKGCALPGIGRSLSRPVACSIATMGSESLFCT